MAMRRSAAAVGAIVAATLFIGHLNMAQAGMIITAWGTNNHGQCNIPAEASNAVAISAGIDHVVALRPDGTVFAWGNNAYGKCTVPADGTGVVAVAAGINESGAVKSDGTVVLWGDVSNDGSMEPMPAMTQARKLALGGWANMALWASGGVSAWGVANESYSNSMVPLSVQNITKISAGFSHCLALTEGGQVIAWGNNFNGQTNVPPTLISAVAIAGTRAGSLAVTPQGTLKGWGNYIGVLPTTWTGVADVRAGNLVAAALFRDNTLATWGELNSMAAGQEPAMTEVYDVTCGDDFVIAMQATSMWFAAALNASTLSWTAGGDAGWRGVSMNSAPDHQHAAESPVMLGDDQEGWVQATVTGPGELRFWWKVSSEANYDWLELYFDGVLVPGGRISGSTDWTQVVVPDFPSGSHQVRWRYVKDVSNSVEWDRGWVDKVEWIPAEALWASAADVGGGWKWLSWFGYFSDAGNGWIHHNEHHWMYTSSTSTADLWFWTQDMGWLWTSATTYPYLYRNSDDAWLWYQKDSVSPRWFYNFKTSLWESR